MGEREGGTAEGETGSKVAVLAGGEMDGFRALCFPAVLLDIPLAFFFS